MSNDYNRMIVFVSILGAILATSILALNPSTITNAGAQMYGDQYRYDDNNNYYQDDNNRHGYDNNHQKKISNTNIQKINCIISNINVNGIDITKIPQDSTTASAANEARAEGTVDAANTQNGDGLSDRINFDRNLANVCINNNDNEQTRVTEPSGPAGPETASLTVKKEIFGCENTEDSLMVCDELENDSPDWIPCTDPAISGTINCQSLPANLFDIEVLDNQNTLIRQFDGSLQGTTIQNLQPGTYKVNEIKHQAGISQDELIESATAEQACTLDEFPDGGTLFNSTAGVFYDPLCFEYEDEFGNNCSTLTLQPGENKICTVKNYMQRSGLD